MNKKEINRKSPYLNYFQSLFEIFNIKNQENTTELTQQNSEKFNSREKTREINSYIKEFLSNKFGNNG